MIKQIIAVLISMITLNSCQKDDTSFVKKNHRIKEIIEIFGGDIREKEVFHYNELNQISRKEKFSGESVNPMFESSYFYESNRIDSSCSYSFREDRITSYTYYSYKNDTIEINTWLLIDKIYVKKHIVDGGILRKTIYYERYDNDSLIPLKYELLNWENNNLIKKETFRLDFDNYELPVEYFEYDSFLNPLFEQTSYNSPYLFESKNNLIKEVNSRSGNDTIIKILNQVYNEQGLLIKTEEYPGVIDTNSMVTYNYIYEEY